MLILLKLNADCIQWRTVKRKKANPLSRRLLYCIWAISCARYRFQTKNLWFAKHRQGSLKEVFLTIVIYLHCLVSFRSNIRHFFTKEFSLKSENELCSENMPPGPREQVKNKADLYLTTLAWCTSQRTYWSYLQSQEGIIWVQRTTDSLSELEFSLLPSGTIQNT